MNRTVYEFDRYRGRKLMAQGVRIFSAVDEADAFRRAKDAFNNDPSDVFILRRVRGKQGETE